MPALRAITDLRSVMAGDDIARTVTIYDGATAFNFTGATVYAAVTDGKQRQYSGPTLQSSSASGASWGTGVLVVEFSNTYSQNLNLGTVFLEIQITLSGKKYSPQLIPFSVELGVIP